MKKEYISASDDDQELLKVAKLNQVKSENLLSALQDERTKVEQSAAETDKYISDLESSIGVNAPEPSQQPHIYVPQITVEDQSWDELVKEASLVFPESLGFEDLLSPQEIADVCRNMEEINAEFSRRTKLTKLDWLFLATATALQCIRQYVIDPWLKNKRKNAGTNDEKGHKENGDPGWYYVDTEKIIPNRVPFDAQHYNPSNMSVQGFLKGAKDHRYVTLGHDPLLGWVFGTANILTSTITRYDLKTAHVKYMPDQMIHSLADNGKMANACKNRLFHEGAEGKAAVALAVVREGIHLKSDVNTKHSLPIPGISAVSPKLAEKLAGYGIDTASIGAEMTFSLLINILISLIHKLFHDESVCSERLYEVRTRKILLYSNLFASSSNLIVTAITKDMSKLDVGGLVITIGRLFSDIRFITKVKQDFIDSKLDIQFEGIESELFHLYNQKLIVQF